LQTPSGWRLMISDDLDSVEAIAAEVHPGFPEDRAVFAERQRLYPEGTHLLEVDGKAAGYLLSHPWRWGSLPALNTLLGGIPGDADTFYLHDLALLPRARGTGAAGMIVAKIIEHARQAGFETMSLVAVNGSMPFWRRHGFVVDPAPALAEKLASYEASARYMVRSLV